MSVSAKDWKVACDLAVEAGCESCQNGFVVLGSSLMLRKGVLYHGNEKADLPGIIQNLRKAESFNSFYKAGDGFWSYQTKVSALADLLEML
jgi:hypothetical protein